MLQLFFFYTYINEINYQIRLYQYILLEYIGTSQITMFSFPFFIFFYFFVLLTPNHFLYLSFIFMNAAIALGKIRHISFVKYTRHNLSARIVHIIHWQSFYNIKLYYASV